ncbi:DUF1992 domain-containing protein [Desulfovibrio sp. OttesenSCG-928-G15]|nr:DUF1992 domain-containing protein [Desulfovibrio sp. OttesenSCG-928-G15]
MSATMNALEAIAFVAERKIEEAMQEGQFDKLPGMGKPLVLEDLSNMPEDMRMAYTLLKNGGFLEANNVPPPASMAEMMRSVPEEGSVYGKMRRFSVLRARADKAEAALLPEKNRREKQPLENSVYFPKLLEKI